jgi:hypothetical protein
VLKIRIEAELEKGDLVSSADATAEALEAAAAKIRGGVLFVPTDIIDVPRGKLAYMIEGK